jgi:hypothetical protein
MAGSREEEKEGNFRGREVQEECGYITNLIQFQHFRPHLSALVLGMCSLSVDVLCVVWRLCIFESKFACLSLGRVMSVCDRRGWTELDHPTLMEGQLSCSTVHFIIITALLRSLILLFVLSRHI